MSPLLTPDNYSTYVALTEEVFGKLYDVGDELPYRNHPSCEKFLSFLRNKHGVEKIFICLDEKLSSENKRKFFHVPIIAEIFSESEVRGKEKIVEEIRLFHPDDE